MKVVYFGDSLCSFETFQRLFLVADEIAFLDRPSVSFGNWGTVGQQSEARSLEVPTDSPVKLQVFKPSWGPAERHYQRYIEADLANPTFVSAFLDGMRSSPLFASRFVGSDLDYGSGKGEEVIAALIGDPRLPAADLTGPVDGARMYRFGTHEERRECAKVLLHEASIKVSAALSIVAAQDCLPVSDDPFMCRLLALRAGDQRYVGSSPQMAAILGLVLAQAVLPDEALSHLTMGDLVDYRKEAKGAYDAWTTEVDRLAVGLGSGDPARLEDELKSLITTELKPRIQEYRNEMKSVRDRMFGSLLKKVAKGMAWEFPTVTLAHYVGLGWKEALAAFSVALVPVVAPDVIDAKVHAREATRKNAMAYLIRAAPEA